MSLPPIPSLTTTTAMDFTKKRKADENGTSIPTSTAATAATALTAEEIRKVLEPLTKDQLLDILQTATVHHSHVLELVRSVASDVSLRKLFIRGLASETTSETLRIVFSPYGELVEAIVMYDKNTGKSKGFGFITFKHADCAMLAIREPSKKIDGRITVTQLASNKSGGSDVSLRKAYVGNIPFEISSERLLGFFSMYGEIEEGPLGFDKSTGKSKGFAFIIYKTEEGARAAIADPMKNIDGHQIVCKLAIDNNKKVNKPGFQGGPMMQTSHPLPQPPQPQNPMPVVTGNFPNYALRGSNNLGLNNSYFVAHGVSPYGVEGTNEFAGLNNQGTMYRMPQSSGSYPDVGPYALSQQQQPVPPRFPHGAYPGMPPRY